MDTPQVRNRIIRAGGDADVEVLLRGVEWAPVRLNGWPSHAGTEHLAALEREGKPVRVAITDSGVRTEVDAISVAITGALLCRRDMGRHRIKPRLEIRCLAPERGSGR